MGGIDSYIQVLLILINICTGSVAKKIAPLSNDAICLSKLHFSAKSGVNLFT